MVVSKYGGGAAAAMMGNELSVELAKEEASGYECYYIVRTPPRSLVSAAISHLA